jgi:NADPH:quinone reductase-like Zn-dependent oxidoreductase
MRAVVQDRYGGVETLRSATIPRPTVGPDQVLIEVRAAGIDRGVWHLMTGLPYLIRLLGYGVRRPRQPVPGSDVSGVVVSVGERVTRWQPGDEVFGTADGSFAEYAVAAEDRLAPKPRGLTFEHAAAAAVSGTTALQALTDVGRLRPGQRVLIVGASGGVGTYAVQLARVLGAEVTGVCSAAKAGLVRSLGADRVIDYAVRGVGEERDRYDLIIDIGGRNPLRDLRRALSPSGTLVITGGEGGDRLTGGLGRQLRAALASPFVGQRLTFFVNTGSGTLLERLAAHLEAGHVIPVVERSYPLADAPAAIARLEAGRVAGKLAVTVGAA